MQAADTAHRAFINVTFPKEALPVPILAILLIGFFALAAMVIRKANQFKAYGTDFPTHPATVIVGLGLAIVTAPVILSRISLGLQEVDGTGNWLTFIGWLAGVTVGGLAVKRFSSPEYMDSKAKVEAAKAGATSPPVNVQGSDVNIQNAPQPTATAERPVVATPQAGVKPKDPTVVAGIEAIAKSQRVTFGGSSQ